MITYIWPMALIVTSTVFYQICAKSIPDGANPFASITVTYLVSTLASAALFFMVGRQGSLFEEYKNINWASFVLGIVVVGIEIGWIYAFRAGWQVSKGFVVQSAFMAVILMMVGLIIYKETITWNKIVGTIICLIGLLFINIK